MHQIKVLVDKSEYIRCHLLECEYASIFTECINGFDLLVAFHFNATTSLIFVK